MIFIMISIMFKPYDINHYTARAFHITEQTPISWMQRLDEEGYGPFLCSEAQIMQWELQFAQLDGREEMTFHELLNPSPTMADCDEDPDEL